MSILLCQVNPGLLHLIEDCKYDHIEGLFISHDQVTLDISAEMLTKGAQSWRVVDSSSED